ncbi:MAG TPA: hypothetical protein VH575_14565 [Gemmataceae bacterium]
MNTPILVPTLGVGTHVGTLRVPFYAKTRRDAERRNRAFPRGAWERGAIRLLSLAFAFVLACPTAAPAQKPKKKSGPVLTFPPTLSGGRHVVTDTSDDFLKAPTGLKKAVAVAKTAPTVDFLFFPGQTYEGKLWSTWGDSLAVDGKYYASLGDHSAPFGNAFVFEYDVEQKKFRRLVDVQKILHLPEGHYTPGKIHSRIDRGDDGFLYFSTHRGSPKTTTDQYHYKGDWILRVHPGTGKSEIVAAAPVPKHSIPCSVLDPKRLIFYGGTAPASGQESEGIHFFAYDIKDRKILYSGPDGPSRYLIFTPSAGRVYFTSGKEDPGPLMRYDPRKGGAPVKTDVVLGLRAATQETPQGFVYTVSSGQGKREPILWSFNTKTEEVRKLGTAAVGTQGYVASLDADPTGRYLYYVPGAHGGSDADGSPVVQFDVRTKQKKVIAFLHPFYKSKYGCTPRGTYSTALSPRGDKLYITWNVSRGSRAWDCVALTVIHIPEAERRP